MTKRQLAIMRLAQMEDAEFEEHVDVIESWNLGAVRQKECGEYSLAKSFKQVEGDALLIFYRKLVKENERNIPIVHSLYVWHVIQFPSKYGKIGYRVRQLTWESYVIAVVNGKDDGLYFFQEAQAIAKRDELNAKSGVVVDE